MTRIRPEQIRDHQLGRLEDVDTAGVTDGQILKFNNTAGEWQPDDLPPAGDTIVPLGTQVFTEDGSYTPHTDAVYITVELSGGGGGGGQGELGSWPSGSKNIGGSGGGGGYAMKRFLIDDLPSPPIPVVVGVGGSGGASGTPTGGTGGTSSFGSGPALVQATGGVGGNGSEGASGPAAGGIGIDGDLNIPGQSGTGRERPAATGSPPGGNSRLGYGGLPRFQNEFSIGGSFGQDWGGGGGGGLVHVGGSGLTPNGGDGADGVVIIHEYGTA